MYKEIYCTKGLPCNILLHNKYSTKSALSTRCKTLKSADVPLRVRQTVSRHSRNAVTSRFATAAFLCAIRSGMQRIF